MTKKAAPKFTDAELAKHDMECLRRILKTPDGRRVMWSILNHCGVFRSIFEQSSKIYYNAGVQDVGHFVLAQVMNADENAFTQMSNESRSLQGDA